MSINKTLLGENITMTNISECIESFVIHPDNQNVNINAKYLEKSFDTLTSIRFLHFQ